MNMKVNTDEIVKITEIGINTDDRYPDEVGKWFAYAWFGADNFGYLDYDSVGELLKDIGHLIPAKIKKQFASANGKKSAAVRKAKGHDSAYYSELSKKYWAQRNNNLVK